MTETKSVSVTATVSDTPYRKVSDITFEILSSDLKHPLVRVIEDNGKALIQLHFQYHQDDILHLENAYNVKE